MDIKDIASIYYSGDFSGLQPTGLGVVKTGDKAYDTSTGVVWEWSGSRWVRRATAAGGRIYLNKGTSLQAMLNDPASIYDNVVKCYIGTDPNVPEAIRGTSKDLIIDHGFGHPIDSLSCAVRAVSTDNWTTMCTVSGELITSADGNYTRWLNFYSKIAGYQVMITVLDIAVQSSADDINNINQDGCIALVGKLVYGKMQVTSITPPTMLKTNKGSIYPIEKGTLTYLGNNLYQIDPDIYIEYDGEVEFKGTWEVYVSSYSGRLAIQVDKGKGEKGDPGPPNTLTIGTVITGETAAATITGQAPNQVLNLVLPRAGGGGGISLYRFTLTVKEGVIKLPEGVTYTSIKSMINGSNVVELLYNKKVYSLSIVGDDYIEFSYGCYNLAETVRITGASTVMVYGGDGHIINYAANAPNAIAAYEGRVFIYTGAGTDTLKSGHMYRCTETGISVYTWVDITPSDSKKLDAPENPGVPGQVLGLDANGKTVWMDQSIFWVESN